MKWSSPSAGIEDKFWEGILPAYFEPDIDFNGTIDGDSAWAYSADHWEIEWQIPLDSGDVLDINVFPGSR